MRSSMDRATPGKDPRMQPVTLIRAVAIFDLAATLPMAVPVLGPMYIAVLFTGFGLLPAPQMMLPLTDVATLFCNLAGILAVLWNGARLLHPEATWLVRLDIRGRIAVAALLTYNILSLDMPALLWLFVASECVGALLQQKALWKFYKLI